MAATMTAIRPRRGSSLGALDDDELVAAFQQTRDNALVEELLRRHEGAVRTVARKFFLAGGDHDDVRQQALIGFWKAVRDYSVDAPASFHSFARACMERHLITAVKAANRMKHQPLTKSDRIATHDAENSEDGEGPRATQLPDVDHEDATVAALALDGLDALPIAISEIESLVAVHGVDYVHELLQERMEDVTGRGGPRLTESEAHVLIGLVTGARYKEIADRMGKTDKFVDNTVQRLRKKLRIAMEQLAS